MKLPAELQFERLSYEEKYHRAVPGYMKRICELYEAVADRCGEEGLELIRDVSRDYGTRIAINLKKKGERKGVAEVGKYLLKVFDMICHGERSGQDTGRRAGLRGRQVDSPGRPALRARSQQAPPVELSV